MMRRFVLAMLIATPVAADGWEGLSGQGLTDALAARTLQMMGQPVTLGFRQDGSVTYEATGEVTRRLTGKWQVKGAQLCTQMPGEDEVCGPVERNRIDLRMTGPQGDPIILRYIDL